jgi:hypothetical protein
VASKASSTPSRPDHLCSTALCSTAATA